MSDQVRTVIIGTGGIANSHVRAMRAAGERVDLTAAMDVDADRVDAFCETHEIPAKYTDVGHMLEKEQPNLVHICTPPGTHCDLIVAALEAGAWVYCEKPLCASLAEMDRIEEAEQRTGNYCSSVFQWRFGSGGQHLKSLIDTGALGNPLVGNCLTVWYRTPAYYAVPWRGKWATELGGCTMGHGIHAMDFFLWLFGEWREVRAMMGTLERDIEVEDVSMAMVRFANGAMGNITNSVLSPREESYLRMDFQKATVELTHLYSYTNDDWRYSIHPGMTHSDELAQWQDLPANLASSHSGQLAEILDCMARNERPAVSGAGVRGTIEFLASLYKSAITGQPVLRGSITKDDPFYHHMNGTGDQSWQNPT
ncbi:MAG: Gfo/Idh/MocA family oxidoreductase [Caldilineaceae bacterium]|nr:Gfo/Idh/MocA family oxidoreductase [Caldilineaceae bacterium]